MTSGITRRLLLAGTPFLFSPRGSQAQFPGEQAVKRRGGFPSDGVLPPPGSDRNLRSEAAKSLCDPSGLCTVALPVKQVSAVYDTQKQSEWCWAASAEMIFAYSGFKVSQQRIVNETFGAPVNMPADFVKLVEVLDRHWESDQGGKFSVRIDKIFSPDLGTGNIHNSDLIISLKSNKPILYANISHAMVIVSVSFFRAQLQSVEPRVVALSVLDPWPGIGMRPLSEAEGYLITNVPWGQARLFATLNITPST